MPKPKAISVISALHVSLPADQVAAVKAAANKFVLGRSDLGDAAGIPAAKLARLLVVHRAAQATSHGELLISIDLSSGALEPSRLLLNGKTYELKEV